MFEIILFIIVIAVLALLFSAWQYYRQQQQAKAFEQEMEAGPGEDDDPFHRRFDSVLSQHIDDDIEIDDDSPRMTLSDEAMQQQSAEAEPTLDTADDASTQMPSESALTATEPAVPDDMLIALTVMASKDALFNGKAVRNALNEQDLHFGEMQVYHRFSTHSRNRIIFSVANVLDPGHLIPDRMLALQTPGLMLFTQLPGPINGMAMFDAMHECAQQLATRLDGHVCDQHRQPLTEQSLEAMRSRIFEFNLALQQDQENVDYDDFR